jgi:hypothetical protein
LYSLATHQNTAEQAVAIFSGNWQGWGPDDITFIKNTVRSYPKPHAQSH